MKGFTLLEAILASAIALIAGTFLVAILINHSGLSYKENSIVSEGLSLNDAMREIDRDVREAASVAVGYPEVSPTYITGTGTLVLKLPSLGQSGILSGIYDYMVVTKDTSQPKLLKLLTFPDPQSTRQSSSLILTPLLDGVQFSYLDKSGNSVTPASATSVKTDLTVLSKTGSIGSNRSSEMITTLRNSQ